MKEFRINNLKNIPINIIEGEDLSHPKAIIVNVHGISSHFQEVYYCEDSIRYRDSLFYPNNIKTYGLEFHGHGKSQGLKCSIDDFDDLVNDLYCLIKYIRNIYNDIPIIIIAESMGGAVAIKYNIKYQFETNIAGYILLAPMCGIDDRLKPHPISISILMLLSNYLPTLPVLKTQEKMNNSCMNEKYMELKEKSDYYYHGKVRLNTARECYYTSLWIKENGKLFNSPLFLLHGLDDTITDPKLSIDFFNNVPNKNKKIYLPKNTNHSLTLRVDDNDLHPKLVWIKIINWISSTLEL
jgi:acylglycerol lipase